MQDPLRILMLATALGFTLGTASAFEVPPDGKPGLWEAEQARPAGAWAAVTDEMASGGAYMSHATADEGGTLEFSFSTDRAGALRIVPVWWRNSEEAAAVRFPKSLPCFTYEHVWPVGFPDRSCLSMDPLLVKEKPGPDRLVALRDRLYFSAPQHGFLGVVDPASEKIVGTVDIGGYIADLAVDETSGLLFAADAQNDMVVVYDDAAGRVTQRIAMDATPYSLALAGEQVLVACMEGRSLVALGRRSLAVENRLALPFNPQAVAVVDGTVVVWPRAQAWAPDTAAAMPVDRLAWPEQPETIWTDPTDACPRPFRNGRLWLKGEKFGRYDIAYERPGKLRFICRSFVPDPAQPNQTRAIDATLAVPELGDAAAPRISPVVQAGELLYFIVPGEKWLFRVDLAAPSGVDRIEIGNPVSLTVFARRADGRQTEWCLGTTLSTKQLQTSAPALAKAPTPPPAQPAATPRECGRTTCICPGADGAPDTCATASGTCYRLVLADGAGRRLVHINAASGRKVAEVALPAEPVHVFVSGDRAYVACAAPDQVLEVAVCSGEIVRTIPLPARPRAAQVFRCVPAEVSWAGLPPLSECPKRLVVHLTPVGFNPGDLQPRPAPPVSFLPPARSAVSVPVDGKPREFWCDNTHVLRVDGKRWLDTSPVTDRHGTTQLGRGDKQGTIALSIDDGPKHDWMLDRFMTESRHHLVRGTDEFDEVNAPVLAVAAGQHVLRVHSSSPWARLDALRVQAVLPPEIRLSLRPEPTEAFDAVPLPSCRAVFANAEPVRFTACLAHNLPVGFDLDVAWAVLDIYERPVASGSVTANVMPGAGAQVPLDLDLKQTGVFTLRATAALPGGEAVTARAYFARLPEMAHPSLFFRAADEAAIGARTTAYPVLFERYRKWLRRNVDQPGFLPKAMGGGVAQTYENMEARWRALGCGMAALFLEPDDAGFYVSRLAPILKSGHQEAYEHAWEFAGASAVLYDMLATKSPEVARYHESLIKNRYDSNRVADTLMATDEPLSPDERSYLSQQLRAFQELVHYMQAHAGTRGGNWWQGTVANCDCPLEGVFRNLMYFQGFLGYDLREFFSAKFFSGAFVHLQYAAPHLDRRKIIRRGLALRGSGAHGTGGEITAMLASLLTGNAVERALYDAAPWLAKMNGPLTGDEDDAVDALMKEGHCHVLPLFLALGWYVPDAPARAIEDLPPSMLFDVEGEVCMKSDWGPGMTDVYFVSGARDVTYRVEPNHLSIVKAGEVLLGTKALQGDHGDPVPSWGNVVLMGTTPPERWQYAAPWPRMDEHRIVDRFSPQLLAYNLRDYALSGVAPMNYPYRNNDGIVLHGHTEHPFFAAGRILAYETWPEFDYTAGDATHAWPIDQAEAAFRQVVYLRPDIVVVYDRGQLGKSQDRTRWLAATAPGLTGQGNQFHIRAGKAALDGIVLMPDDAKLDLQPGLLAFDGAPDAAKGYEYLVVLQTATGKGRPVDATLVRTDRQTGVTVRFGNRTAEVRFDRTGAVGGGITLGELRNQPLVRDVAPSYRHWQKHCLFKKWMQDKELRPYIVDADAREFGTAALPDIPAPPRQEYPVPVTGLAQGTLHCGGSTALQAPGPECPNLDLRANDFLVQARFRFNPDSPLDTAADSYTLLMKGVYEAPLFQLSLRGGQYNGVFARGRNTTGKGYLDVVPATSVAKQLCDGQFHTVAFVRAGNTGRLFLDGAKIAERTDFEAQVQNDHALEIGKACQGGFFDGEIDDVRVWRFDAGLPAGWEDALARYETTRDDVPAVLKDAPDVKFSIWRLDDDAGATSARDSGSNGYPLRVLDEE